MRRWWLPCFLALALASPWAGAQGTATESLPSASSDNSRSNGSAAPTSGSSESEPQTPIDAWQILENEWLGFTTEWDAFWPELQALGIGLGELPSYWKSLDESLKQERSAREAADQANAEKAAEDAEKLAESEKKAEAWKEVAILAIIYGIGATAAAIFIKD